MSKKRQSRHTVRRERVAVANATTHRPTTVVRRAPLVRLSPPPPPVSPVLRLEDRREWHPERAHRPVRATRRPATRIVARDPLHNPVAQTKAILAFQEPKKVAVCVRREVRKRVLHALNKSGRNGQRRRRTNPQSRISCRR